MSLKKSHGNMYSWVSHVHAHLGGECTHKCVYCYVWKSRFGRPEKYTGPPRLIESELAVDYGSGRIIFIEHMNDLFANSVPCAWKMEVLAHCRRYPENEYIFQTKNPGLALSYLESFPPKFMIGTTVETNRDLDYSVTLAPQPLDRIKGIGRLMAEGARTFITIEPVLDFDPHTLAGLIASARPEFVNIGADSKGCGLEEPSGEKVLKLIALLSEAGVTIRKKINLERLIGRLK